MPAFSKLLMNKIQGFPLGMVYRLYNEWDILTIATLANCGQLDFIHQLYINLKRIVWLQIGCLFYTPKVFHMDPWKVVIVKRTSIFQQNFFSGSMLNFTGGPMKSSHPSKDINLPTKSLFRVYVKLLGMYPKLWGKPTPRRWVSSL